MPKLTQTDLTEEEMERLQSVIKEFLTQSEDELFETRIQKLIFFSEVYCILHYQHRITPAEYRPYMYGAYSRDVSLALEQLDGINRRRTIVHGDRTTGFSIKKNEPHVGDNLQKIIEKVCTSTKDEDTEDLAQFSKDSWLFTNTEYNHPMKFPKFAKALKDHPDIKERLLKKMPERVSEVDEQDSLLPLDV
jgi:uncharacterized protein YwgA